MRPYLLSALLALGFAPTGAQTPHDFDLLILSGTVYRDGDSAPTNADVGITADRIVAVGDLRDRTAATKIDATGLLVVPGFIDMHSHADRGGPEPELVRQGVTTRVAGNCGRTPAVPDFADFYAGLDGNLDTNYIGLIGHNSLRAAVDLVEAEYTDDQMERMKLLVADGMEAGAFGLSTGLIYFSGYNSTTEEIIELAKVAAQHGGIYASHMRSENARVMDAVDEALRIGRESGARVQISHAKCAGPVVWGMTADYTGRVEAAVGEGMEVWMDQYPYTASQTSINAVIPGWALNDWEDAVANRRVELVAGIDQLIAGRGGAERIYMTRGPFANEYLSEAAARLGKTPTDTIIDEIGRGGASAVYHMMLEEDVRAIMVHPRVMVGTDGPSQTHPRGQGTFPRVWGVYGRELGLLDHQDCVRKTSTLAARQLRLFEQRRGRIDTGYFADIAIIDPAEVIDSATFEDPTGEPAGIPHVIVNGTLVVHDGVVTGALPGRFLRRQDSEG
jgi:N-acyl-D-amino-acid deacylase